MSDESKLKPCPFCGCEAVVKVNNDAFQIVGCSVASMLCPNPSMVVYPKDGEFDYTFWNTRWHAKDERCPRAPKEGGRDGQG